MPSIPSQPRGPLTLVVSRDVNTEKLHHQLAKSFEQPDDDAEPSVIKNKDIRQLTTTFQHGGSQEPVRLEVWRPKLSDTTASFFRHANIFVVVYNMHKKSLESAKGWVESIDGHSSPFQHSSSVTRMLLGVESDDPLANDVERVDPRAPTEFAKANGMRLLHIQSSATLGTASFEQRGLLDSEINSMIDEVLKPIAESSPKRATVSLQVQPKPEDGCDVCSACIVQ